MIKTGLLTCLQDLMGGCYYTLRAVRPLKNFQIIFVWIFCEKIVWGMFVWETFFFCKSIISKIKKNKTTHRININIWNQACSGQYCKDSKIITYYPEKLGWPEPNLPAAHETFLIFMLEKKNYVEFDFSIHCILVNVWILWIERYIYIYILSLPPIPQIYVSQMTKHGKFSQYLTIVTTDTCISTRNLMKMLK